MKECRPSTGDMPVVRGGAHGPLHKAGQTLLKCTLFALLILPGAASAQLSTRDPAPETPPSGESAPTDDGSTEADAPAEGEPAATSPGEGEVEATEQPQLLSQLEQFLAELETLREENARLREQLDAARVEAAAQEQSPAEPSQGEPEQAGTQQDEPSPQLQAELSELQRQVQIINDEHAALLAQLAGAEEAAPEEQRTHVVQAGDLLSGLAKRYYGSGSRWPEILAANPSLTNPDRLIPGTVLVIP